MTRYHAKASLGERFWLIHIEEIDQWTQARTLNDVDLMARDLVAVWLDADPDDIDIDVDIELPAPVREHLERATAQRTVSDHAKTQAAIEYRAAAHQLKDRGLTVRDIGKALHISYQRAQQLLTSPVNPLDVSVPEGRMRS